MLSILPLKKAEAIICCSGAFRWLRISESGGPGECQGDVCSLKTKPLFDKEIILDRRSESLCLPAQAAVTCIFGVFFRHRV